jgi:peptidyl-prolyl cis-trans isomerase A (cyclophilin A)
MPTAGPNTNGSQFFITEVATPHLNGGYTIFGQCDAATVALVKQIARMATDPSNNRPFRPVKIIHIKIVHGERPGSQRRSQPCNQAAGQRELTTLSGDRTLAVTQPESRPLATQRNEQYEGRTTKN